MARISKGKLHYIRELYEFLAARKRWTLRIDEALGKIKGDQLKGCKPRSLDAIQVPNLAGIRGAVHRQYYGRSRRLSNDCDIDTMVTIMRTSPSAQYLEINRGKHRSGVCDSIDVKPDPNMCHTPGYIDVVCGAMPKTPFVFPPGGA